MALEKSAGVVRGPERDWISTRNSGVVVQSAAAGGEGEMEANGMVCLENVQ